MKKINMKSKEIYVLYLKEKYSDLKLWHGDNLLYAWTPNKQDLKKFLESHNKKIFKLKKIEVSIEDYKKIYQLNENKKLITFFTNEVMKGTELYLTKAEKGILISTLQTEQLGFATKVTYDKTSYKFDLRYLVEKIRRYAETHIDPVKVYIEVFKKYI